MPKSAMGLVKFTAYVGVAILVLEWTGVMDKARAVIKG